jgi:hypothetical protein
MWRKLCPEQFRSAPASSVGTQSEINDLAADHESPAASSYVEMLRDQAEQKRKDRPPGLVFGGDPYDWRDPEDVPPRDWIYSKHYIRGYVSTTLASGGVGKSSLALVEALDMATGYGLLTGVGGRQYRVLYWCGEDPLDEIERRVAAACKHYGIIPEAVGDRLILVSGREHKFTVATVTREGTRINKPAVESMILRMIVDDIDVLICDPFVCTHACPENDNSAINEVVNCFRDIADMTCSAVELVHHTRKSASGQSGHERTVDDGRGAGALVAAARSARVLNVMSADEAATLGIPDEERRRYFRLDSGKANLTPPAKAAVWRHLASVDLQNGCNGRPSDHVGVVEVWERPAADAGVTEAHVAELQRRLTEGAGNRRDSRSPEWAGIALAAVLDLDVSEKATRKRLQTILNGFIKAKLLRVVLGSNGKGRSVECLMPGAAVTSTVATV